MEALYRTATDCGRRKVHLGGMKEGGVAHVRSSDRTARIGGVVQAAQRRFSAKAGGGALVLKTPVLPNPGDAGVACSGVETALAAASEPDYSLCAELLRTAVTEDPTVVTLVVTSTASWPVQERERWRVEFAWPAGPGLADVKAWASDELTGTMSQGVVAGYDRAVNSIAWLAVRAYRAAKYGKPQLPAFRPFPATWHRVDFAVHSYGGGSPFGTNQLRLAIDAADPQSISVHWDDGANLGTVKGVRRKEDADPIRLALSEALNGRWAKARTAGETASA